MKGIKISRKVIRNEGRINWDKLKNMDTKLSDRVKSSQGSVFGCCKMLWIKLFGKRYVGIDKANGKSYTVISYYYNGVCYVTNEEIEDLA